MRLLIFLYAFVGTPPARSTVGGRLAHGARRGPARRTHRGGTTGVLVEANASMTGKAPRYPGELTGAEGTTVSRGICATAAT
jgi:hypothetical protein